MALFFSVAFSREARSTFSDTMGFSENFYSKIQHFWREIFCLGHEIWSKDPSIKCHNQFFDLRVQNMNERLFFLEQLSETREQFY